MKLPVVVIIQLSLGAVANVAASFEFYQEQIKQLSHNATLELQMKREAHRLAIVQLSAASLAQIGNTTVHGRRRTVEARQFIGSFNGQLNDWQKACLDEALVVQKSYTEVLEYDLSNCAYKVYIEAAVDSSKQFREYAGSIQLAAFLALNQAMAAFELENSAEARERYLREELEFFAIVWSLYSSLLENKLDEQKSQYEEVVQSLERCLDQAIFFYDYTMNYIKANLETCFAE